MIFTITYNIFFHPLRHYSGPWYRAASRLPYTVTIFRGGATHRVAALHERYGDVVRIAPDTLSYITAEAWPGMSVFVFAINGFRLKLMPSQTYTAINIITDAVASRKTQRRT
jgi:hypothetical protein